MNTRYTYYFLFALIISFASCAENKTAVEPAEGSPERSSIRVEKLQFTSSDFALGKVEEMAFKSSLTVIGNIHLPEKSQAAVSSLLDGTVGTMNIIDGQWVAIGKTLFTITNPELINMQEAYLVAKSELGYLKKEYTRQQELATENITTKKELFKTKSELDVTSARYSAVKKKLDLYGIKSDLINASSLTSTMPVKAPISGYVFDISVLRGSYLQASTLALKIANTNQVHLELSILEKDGRLLKKGQQILFKIQNDPSKTYTAKVHQINKMIGENKMICVHADIDDTVPKGVLMPGMFVDAEIVLENKTSAALPKGALVKMGSEWHALKLLSTDDAGYEFEEVTVKVGEENDDHISVKNMTVGESQYLTKGAYFLIQ